MKHHRKRYTAYMLVDPDGRVPAPEPLRLVQAFVNTLDIENDVEELSSTQALASVLVRIGALPDAEAELADGDLRIAIDAREALRELTLANSGLPVSPGSLATLERVARAAH